MNLILALAISIIPVAPATVEVPPTDPYMACAEMYYEDTNALDTCLDRVSIDRGLAEGWLIQA